MLAQKASGSHNAFPTVTSGNVCGHCTVRIFCLGVVRWVGRADGRGREEAAAGWDERKKSMWENSGRRMFRLLLT